MINVQTRKAAVSDYMRYFKDLRSLTLLSCLGVAVQAAGGGHQSRVVLVDAWKRTTDAGEQHESVARHNAIPGQLFKLGRSGQVTLLYLGFSNIPSSDINLTHYQVQSLLTLGRSGIVHAANAPNIEGLAFAVRKLSKSALVRLGRLFRACADLKGEPRLLRDRLLQEVNVSLGAQTP